jgi:hypothetical protein
MLEQWLNTIRAVWPECPARISHCGQSLIIAHCLAVHRSAGAATIEKDKL